MNKKGGTKSWKEFKTLTLNSIATLGYKKRHIVARSSVLSIHDRIGSSDTRSCYLHTKDPGKLLEKHEQ